MSVFRFWSQQDSNPSPGYYHADVLPLRHFDPQTLINLVYFDIFVYQKFVQRYNKYKTNLERGTLSSIKPHIRLGISIRATLRALPSG